MQFLVMPIRLSIIFSLLQLADALRFTSIQMPALVQRATNFWLACQFELAPGQQLYSVKWYKNNEEFYRILMGTSASASTSGLDAAPHLGMAPTSGDKFHQQYFSQAGVNVLMSASNATHVRLLNASLESEGAYACEISSENLSTIRHEREIKVYVLPHVRLSLIGLRSLYAPGERVELHCSSDFSRPGGALAWFINGHQITTNSRHFELEWRRSSQAQLERVGLVLKFKLVDELLLGANQQPSEWRNQSLKLSSRTEQQENVHQQKQQQQQQQIELLKLECRFKLTDVSDVTFNELKLGRAARERRQLLPLSRPTTTTTTNRRVVLTKSQGQQVTQATRRIHSLKHALAATVAGTVPGEQDACPLGSLALQPDDPIILETSGSGQDQTDQELSDEENSVDADERLAVASVGTTLNLNCTTLESLLLDSGSRVPLTTTTTNSANHAWPLGPQRRKPRTRTGHINADESGVASETQVEMCADWSARRRAIISGKYQWPQLAPTADAPIGHEDSQTTRARAHKLRNQQQQQVAYIKLEGDLLASRLAAESARTPQVTKSLAQLERHPQQSQEQQQHQSQLAWQLRAPPLLEWFINNQEAPKASATYSPELPLVPAAARQAATASARRQLSNSESSSQLDSSSLDGTTGGPLDTATEQDSALLPSIDYARYFANFDARPLEQHLKLNLKLDKKHFMTSDSQLTLRCTSTQAQVLMVDSVSVSFLLAPPAILSLNNADSLGKSQQQNSNWQQRPVTSNNQIKPKYVHQYPRSSNQKFASASPNYRQEYLATSKLKSGNNAVSSAIRIPSTIELLIVLMVQSWTTLRLVFTGRIGVTM